MQINQTRSAKAARANRILEQYQTFSLSRLFSCMAEDKLDGFEREYLQESLMVQGKGNTFDPHRVEIPLIGLSDPSYDLGSLKRDLIASSASAGGYLVGTGVAPAADILRPWSVAARAGITFMQQPIENNITIPKTNTASTSYWLSNESATVTSSTPLLGQVTLAPKTCGAMIRFSRQLAKQSPQLDAVLQRELLRTVGTLIDKAIFNGSGASGQPTGLLNTAGLSTQSGTSLAWAGITAMEQTSSDANVDDASVAFISTPAIRKLLKTREAITGGGIPIWNGDTVSGRAAHVTTDMPAVTMVSGPWSDIVQAIWGGIKVEIDPYTAFTTGQINARLLISTDVAVLHPAAFCVASSIT